MTMAVFESDEEKDANAYSRGMAEHREPALHHPREWPYCSRHERHCWAATEGVARA